MEFFSRDMESNMKSGATIKREIKYVAKVKEQMPEWFS